MTRRGPSLRTRLSRVNQEAKVLEALVEAAPLGLTLGQLRDKFPEGGVLLTLTHLLERHQVQRFEGLVYAITDLGRSRLTPAAPVCVATVS